MRNKGKLLDYLKKPENFKILSAANILCEKSLIPDSKLCISRDQLVSSIEFDNSTLINVDKRFTAAMCIYYCQGLKLTYPYAIAGPYACACGTKLIIDPASSNSTLNLGTCGFSDSLSQIGYNGYNGK